MEFQEKIKAYIVTIKALYTPATIIISVIVLLTIGSFIYEKIKKIK